MMMNKIIIFIAKVILRFYYFQDEEAVVIPQKGDTINMDFNDKKDISNVPETRRNMNTIFSVDLYVDIKGCNNFYVLYDPKYNSTKAILYTGGEDKDKPTFRFTSMLLTEKWYSNVSQNIRLPIK